MHPVIVAPAQNYFQLFFFLLSLHVISQATSDQPTIITICPTSDTNFTSNSTYHSNLNQLLLALPEAGSATGFSLVTQGQAPAEVFGRVLCRGDKTADYCLACLKNASKEIITFCTPRRRALIYYDGCMLAYADTNDTTSDEKSKIAILVNTVTASNEHAFEDVYNNLMGSLATKASNSSPMFGVGKANYTGSITMYGLTQCIRYLSPDDCYTCLQRQIQYFAVNYPGNQGGQVFGYECFFRMEIYHFFYDSFIEVPPPPPPLNPPDANNSTWSKSNHGSKDRKKMLAVVLVPLFSGLLMILAVCLFFTFRAKFVSGKAEDDGNSRSFLYKAETLRIATDNFSPSNKLGEGGFGSVYKGILPNGEAIAVKRLSIGSGQGISELKNEVTILVKLRHKNLVNLLGFCLEENEKMLIYEFLPNKSLDKFLSDPQRSDQLDWQKRYQIIEGIARGLLYLHEEYRLKIVHRDLKTSNILLDENMLPKISDFGLSKLFAMDKSRTITSRIVGTNGYIAPETLLRGSVSTKSDIFSYGVIILEILTGRSVSDFDGSGRAPNLISFVWKKWSSGRVVQVIDVRLQHMYQVDEVLRCIHIALLCVQSDPSKRPDIASVYLMLSSYSMNLPQPSNPAFLVDSSTTTTDGAVPSNSSANPQKKQHHKRSKKEFNSNKPSINYVTITEMEPR